MAYRDAVVHIEQMNPEHVEAVGRECLNARGVIKSVLPQLMGVGAGVRWRSDARELLDRRLAKVVELTEALYHGFEKAGLAIFDYADAQRRAQAYIREGIAAEERLCALIAPLVATQSVTVRGSDALRQWHDLREVTGALDYLMEAPHEAVIRRIRPRAELLWYQAVDSYDRALELETEARMAAADQLRAAARLLPDFRGNPALVHYFNDTERLPSGHKYHLGPPLVPPIALDSTFAFDPAAVPTQVDRWLYASWLGLLGLAQTLPHFDDATEAYAHYVNATGTDLRIDYEEAYAEDPGICRVVDAEILSAQREAERLFAETGQTAFRMTGQATPAGDLSGEDYPAVTENWQKTLGGHVVYGTSDVVVQGNQITMKVTVHAADMYNFNHGGTDIATGAPNEVNGRFATLGLAKEFRSHGELERTITWTIGDLPDPPAATTGTANRPG